VTTFPDKVLGWKSLARFRNKRCDQKLGLGRNGARKDEEVARNRSLLACLGFNHIRNGNSLKVFK
jgi:hypothetical protein